MLPPLIEIVPLTKPVQAQITVPGSKSITNRALILAALGQGQVTLYGALWSEDTQVMVDCLKKLGFNVSVAPDPEEFCNRTITVQGLAGKIPNAGTPEKPLELFVGNAGTAARFLSALVCLGNGVYRLHGVPRMHERPQAALFQALRELGYRVESEHGNDKLPAIIHGTGPHKGESTVSIEDSSQFASALLLCANVGNWDIKVVGENAEESPYVAMTLKLIEAFPKKGGNFQIEPDASSGSYFWGAGWLLTLGFLQELINTPRELILERIRGQNRIRVSNWPDSGWQLDAEFTVFITSKTESVPIEFSRKHDLADSIMTAIVLAPLAKTAVNQIKFTDLGRLRVQECERVVALRTELTKCGAKVVESGDTLTVVHSELHGAEIETYNDHRMAMCFAILGLKVSGIKIRNPACVKKTFPNFFQKLAASPPHGLGATILDAKTGRELSGNELFAD
jgi:3-phosphoshikimate 1-carboxyvinyltransferase